MPRKIFTLLLLFNVTASALAAEIRVFAAASLTDAVKSIATDYQHATGNTFVFNFASSSTLARQIEEGAPADVFLSADEQTMDRLQKANLIDVPTRVSVLSNILVVVMPVDRVTHLASIRDLTSKRFSSIALAEPSSVPAGIYARQYLTSTGIWAAIAPKVIPTENVRAALAAVESGDVDAAIVYRTDALISKKVGIGYEVARAEGPAISYPFAVVADSPRKEAARKFLAWLVSSASKKTFTRYGFELVK